MKMCWTHIYARVLACWANSWRALLSHVVERSGVFCYLCHWWMKFNVFWPLWGRDRPQLDHDENLIHNECRREVTSASKTPANCKLGLGFSLSLCLMATVWLLAALLWCGEQLSSLDLSTNRLALMPITCIFSWSSNMSQQFFLITLISTIMPYLP